MVGLEISLILATIVSLIFLSKKQKNIIIIFLITFIGVLLFEYFTQALWENIGLADWAYLYLDIAWILTLGWTLNILWVTFFVSKQFKNMPKIGSFVTIILLSSLLGIVGEIILVKTGIRVYSPEVLALASGNLIAGAVPIESLYYVPAFMTLVVAFKRYWQNNLRIGGED